MSSSKLNKIYDSMKRRCYNVNCARYKDYGGRGITICDEWINSVSLQTVYYSLQ